MIIATIRRDAAEWGIEWGISLHPLDAKRTISNGYGVSEADDPSAIPASIGGAPQDARPGAHPFWPGDRAMHGTGSAAVAGKKNHPTWSFRMRRYHRIASAKDRRLALEEVREALGDDKLFGDFVVWALSENRSVSVEHYSNLAVVWLRGRTEAAAERASADAGEGGYAA